MFSNTLNISCISKYVTCFAACELHSHCSSCSVMCPRTAAAVGAPAGEMSYQCHTFTCAHTHTEEETRRLMCERTHTHPLQALAEITCFTRTLERRGGETYDKLWHFHSSYKRYNCPQSVKMCCMHVSDQKPTFITGITSNIPKCRNNANLFVLRGTYLLYTLINNRKKCWFINKLLCNNPKMRVKVHKLDILWVAFFVI